MYHQVVVLVIAFQVLLLRNLVLWVSTGILLLVTVSQLQLPVRVINIGTAVLALLPQ